MTKQTPFAGISQASEASSLEAELRAIRKSMLSEMRLVLNNWKNGGWPAHHLRILFGMTGTLIGAVFIFAEPLAELVGGFYGAVALGGSAAAVVGYLMHLFDASPRSHADHVDQLLSQYCPANVEAYKALKALQEHVKQTGVIDRKVVSDWLDQEISAARIEELEERDRQRASKRLFADRKL